MYTRWRPVPSARTVRILYQLGYICSGTAVGLATLCLEEQRRRIQILQRIADNAKVIRQHPRYRGSVALALEHGEEYESDVISTPWTSETSVRNRSRRRIHPSERSGGAIEGPNLPSVVGREYSELFERRPGQVSTVSRAQTSTAKASRERSQDTLGLPTSSNGDSSKLRLPPFPFFTKTDKGGAPNWRLRSRRSKSQDDWQYRTMRLTDDKKVSLVQRDISADDVGHDVRLFLRTVVESSSESLEARRVPLKRLFQLAVDLGSLEDVQALSLWKLSNKRFTESDAEYLCNAVVTLGERHDEGELAEFFASIFYSEELRNVGVRVQLKLAFTAVARSLHEPDCATPGPVLEATRRICTRDVDGVIIAEVMGNMCEGFVQNGETAAAVRLFCLIAKPQISRFTPDQQLALSAKLFDLVAATGAASHCATLLRWKASRVSYEVLLPTLNDFIRLCGEKHANKLLYNIFGATNGIARRWGWQRLLDDLIPSNRAILAIAFSLADVRRSEELYRSMPQDLRNTVTETVVKNLKYRWRSTRNFEEVDRMIRTFAKRLEESDNERSLYELDEIAFEIYVSASKMDFAMETVTRLHNRSGASSVAMCETAFMWAKQGSWDLFDRTLDVMEKSLSFRFNAEVARTFNATLHIYCQHHGPEEIMMLIRRAIRNLGLIPNSATSEIILGSFVIKQRFDLMLAWAELLSTSDRTWEIGASLAATLLRRYYIDQRPSHIFMMLLCRKLMLHSPSFVSEDIVNLVEQAIAYDLRHLSGPNAAWQRVHAEKRLQRLKGMKNFVPSPGFVWNEQIYFHDSQTDIDWSAFTSPSVVSMSRSSRAANGMGFDNYPDDINGMDEDIDVDLENLRSNGVNDNSNVPAYHSLHDYEYNVQGQKKLEGHMWLHMSTGAFERVLQLYHENLDEAGLPASPVVLEIAVEASLRSDKGDQSNALAIMSNAREAGMNTTCALGPLLVHQLRSTAPKAELDALKVRQDVLDYYKSNEENGWRVGHFLGCYAADLLIRSTQTRQGLELLSTIYSSTWAEKRPLDIVALGVFLKGYIAIQNVEGVRWVVRTVLEQNIRISKRFLKRIRFLTKAGSKWMDQHLEKTPLFLSWVQAIEERQKEQTEEVHRLGWELVERIVQCSNGKSHAEALPPVYPKDGLLAGDVPLTRSMQDPDFVDESYYSDEPVEESGISKGLDEFRRHIIEDWNAEKVFRRRLKASALARKTRDKQSPLILEDMSERWVLYPLHGTSEYSLHGPWKQEQKAGKQESDRTDFVEPSFEADKEAVEAQDDVEDAAKFKPFF